MNIAIVLSGGRGTRLGLDTPKQYIEVGGRMIISYCLLSLFGHEMIDGVVVVADEEYDDLLAEVCDNPKFMGYARPGENRQLSIFNGLCKLEGTLNEQDVVFIHDAARPGLSAHMITECLLAVDGHDGVLPVLPMKDTVYYSEDGKVISSLLDRNKIYAGQAPEAFVYGKYMEANKALMPAKILDIKGSTEPAIMYGMDICMIQGDESNYKITTMADLEKFRSEVER